MVYFGDMLDTAQRAVVKVANLTRTEFDNDENLRLAVAHLIQILGEAASQVSSAMQETYPNIPWREIIGMRHRIVHHYVHVDDGIVWLVATEKLLPLIIELQKIVPPDDSTGEA